MDDEVECQGDSSDDDEEIETGNHRVGHSTHTAVASF